MKLYEAGGHAGGFCPVPGSAGTGVPAGLAVPLGCAWAVDKPETPIPVQANKQTSPATVKVAIANECFRNMACSCCKRVARFSDVIVCLQRGSGGIEPDVSIIRLYHIYRGEGQGEIQFFPARCFKGETTRRICGNLPTATIASRKRYIMNER